MEELNIFIEWRDVANRKGDIVDWKKELIEGSARGWGSRLNGGD